MRYLGVDIDFSAPPGASSFVAADSITWRVFKNPVALVVGGILAVLLELAEPRVRHGVWDHTTFRTRPMRRMRRTATAAMITVYAPRETAEAVIARISRMHARVSGTTPEGLAYSADDPELLTWVQATASFGFLEAYCALVEPLGAAARDRFLSEGRAGAGLYGAVDVPPDRAGQRALFETMAPRLGPSPVISEFLAIMRRTLPWPVGPRAIRLAVALLPDDIRARIGLEAPAGGSRLLRTLARRAERTPLPASPPVQACRRMGLPASFLFTPRPTLEDAA